MSETNDREETIVAPTVGDIVRYRVGSRSCVGQVIAYSDGVLEIKTTSGKRVYRRPIFVEFVREEKV